MELITHAIHAIYLLLWGDLVTLPLPGGGSLGVSLLVLLLIQYLVLYWVEAGRFSALPSALGHAFLGAGVTFAVSVVILSLNSVRSGRSRRRQW